MGDDLDEVDADFGAFEAVAFEDLDFEMLLDPAYDGIENTADPREEVVNNLRFDVWFAPFNDDRVVHPYVDEGQSDKRALRPWRDRSARTCGTEEGAIGARETRTTRVSKVDAPALLASLVAIHLIITPWLAG